MHKELGSRIQLLRQQKGLTQDELSDMAGLSYSTLAKIERGAIKNPSIFTISGLAASLGITLDQIMQPTDQSIGADGNESIKFLFCDVNGVLVRFFQAAFVSIADEYGLNQDKVETAFWHYNDPGNRGEISNAEFDKAFSMALGVKNINWKQHYLKAVDPILAMHDCLIDSAKNVKVGLLTNILPGFLDDLLKKELIPNIDYACIVDSSKVGSLKPEPEIYKTAEKMSGHKGSEILFVDDSRTNIMAAERFNWRVLWFDDYRPEESVKRVQKALEQA